MTKEEKLKKIDKQINKQMKKRKVKFNKLLKEAKEKNLAKKMLMNRMKYKWEEFVIDKDGKVRIRCQGAISNSKPPKQCRAKAIKDKLFCRVHGGRSRKDQDKFDEMKMTYSGKDFKGLQKELGDIENINPEELQDTTNELKVAISLLRAYLKKTTDDRITNNPGQLMYIIGEIARLKKEHYEMKHAKNFTFTKEQVMMMFIQFQTVLIEVIKDTTLLNEISNRIKTVSNLIEQDGFKR